MTSTDLATASPVTLSPVLPDADLVLAELKGRTARLAELEELADQHQYDSRAASTWRVYTTDWAMYRDWCDQHGRAVFPDGPGTDAARYVSETIRLYITDLGQQGRAGSTITKKLSSLSVAYALAGVTAHRQIVWAEPVTSVLHGIRRQQAEAGRRTRKKKALRVSDLRKILAPLTGEPLDVRDRVLLLVLLSGAYRRSEVADLDVLDFAIVENGLEVVLGRSKTDQLGQTLTKGLPYGSRITTCPVRSWQAWRKVYDYAEGPAFPSMDQWGNLKRGPDGRPRRMDGRAVAEVLKRRAKAAEVPGDWGGHSGRRGFATEAYEQDEVREVDIMRQGGWKSPNVMRGYREEAGVWGHNAAARIGL